MRTGLLFFLAGTLLAQGPTLSTSAVSRSRAGQPVTVTLTFTAGGTEISGFQFETPVQPWTTTLANKQMSCSASTQRCILVGEDNADALTSGEVGAAITTPPSLPATITMSGIVATTPDGQATPLGTPAPLVINLLGDVTGDGVLDLGDVQSVLTQVRDGPCVLTSGDQNDDGQCNVVDVQIVVNEVLSGGG